MKVLTLTGQAAKLAACRHVMEAKEGDQVVIREPKRNLDQNAALWPLLECFSRQLKWTVNGEFVRLDPAEWKDVLSAAFDEETVRLAEGLNGGKIMLGKRTSQFSKKRFSEFLEFIHAAAAQRGVVFHRNAEAA